MNFRTSAVVTISTILSSCGGGSGSEGGPKGNGPPGGPPWTSVYSGNRDPTMISRDSAATSASLALVAMYVPDTYEGMWLPNPLGSGTGDINEVVAGPDNGSAVVTGRIEQNHEGYIDVEFRKFQYGTTILDGLYKQNYGPGDSGQMEFIDLNVTTDIGQIVYSGTTDIAEGRQHIVTSLIVSWPGDHQQLYLENVAVDFSGTMIGTHEVGQREMSGTIYATEVGRLTVESNDPIVAPKFDETADSFIATRGGGFYIRGNGPLLQFRALSRQYAALALDSDSDSEIDEGYRLTWRELFQLDDPQLVATDGPIANAGGTAYGTVGTAVNVHGFFSHDDDGDWLRYEWRLASRPPGSNLQLGTSSGPEFSFTPDTSGDYVISLQVTDGVSTSQSSLLVLVDANSNRVGSEDPPTGNIEITSAVAAGAPIIVDARSAANIPYIGAEPAWAVFGPGNASVVATATPYVAEMITDQPGRFIVGMTENGWSPGIEEASRYVTVAVGSQDFEIETWLGIDDKAIAREIIPYDFNLDGRLDVATRLLQDGGYSFHWLLANASGGFDAGPIQTTGAGGMDVGDLNGDGLPDVAVADLDGVYVGFQQAAGSMADFVLYPYSATPCDVVNVESSARIGDIDGDSRDDLIVLRGCDHSIVYWLNEAGSDLVGPTELVLPKPAIDLQTADFNGDARVDLVLGLGQNPGSENLDDIVVAHGQADGSFELGARLPYIPLRNSRPIIGDLDSNARPDILIFENNGYVVLEGLSDGSFVETKSSSQILNFFYGIHAGGYGVVADIDDDGDADIVACSGIDQLNISYLQSDGSYVHVSNGNCSWHKSAKAVAVFDFNNDGFKDLLVGGEGFSPAYEPPWYFLRVLFGNLSPYSKPVF